MTAIIGYADGTHVYMGGDSRGLGGMYSIATLQDRKVIRVGARVPLGATPKSLTDGRHHSIPTPPTAIEEAAA